MRIISLLLLLSFAITNSVAKDKKKDKAYSNVHHYRSNISVNNFDGSSSSIFINGNTATLSNADGTQSTIEIFGNSSTVICIDGTRSTIMYNGMSTTVFNSDGSQFTINHMLNRSTCSAPYGKHTIRHIFGDANERRHKKVIDVLVHTNWYVRKKVAEAMVELEIEEQQN